MRAWWCVAMLGLVGCPNPQGEVTVSNHYTGACGIEVKFGEFVTEYEPIVAGADVTEVVDPGIVLVGFKADGMVCGNQLCAFKDSMNFNLGSCGVYAAGAGLSALVEVVDDVAQQCPSGDPFVPPALICAP